ncbi:MAG: exo-alpha-sialidase [Planctomycetaceae bacterium]|nr:exo-alpha-sialidase [Planctomycetaceae bacterium]
MSSMTLCFGIVTAIAAGGTPEPPVRVADVIGGHVHPALCRAANGDLLAVYNKEGGGGKELLLSRSTDGGKSWSASSAVPGITDCSIYPGSLTTLSDGSIVLHWSCYHKDGERLWRQPQFTVSKDHGRTWGKVGGVPLEGITNYSCLRHSVLELSPTRWVLPLYDRTVTFNAETSEVTPFGDGRNHGMVPIVRTKRGTLISGAPVVNSTREGAVIPLDVVRGLRSTDEGKTWTPLHALPTFGVAGYDLTALDDGTVILTSIVYGVGQDGEWAYDLTESHDDGVTWDYRNSITVYNPRRRIDGRGWPRTVAVDRQTLGTLFYDLNAKQPGGPGVFFVRSSRK